MTESNCSITFLYH